MNTMKMFWSIALLASVIPSVSFAQAGPPSKPAYCSEMPGESIEVLRELCRETEDANIPNDFKKKADRDGLVGKVVAAAFKMAQGKPCDAYQKLRDYETSLDLLTLTAGTAKAKISERIADLLQEDLNAAMGAIAPISCQ